MKPAIESTDIRSLRKILSEITSDLRNSFAKCIKAGELFTKIKSNTKHGDWDGVLQAVGASFNTAKRYMAVWERRAELNLNEIKSLSDAENVFAKIARLEITTTQNEPLTHEKTSNSESSNRRIRPVEISSSSGKEKTHQGASASNSEKIPEDRSRANLNGKPEVMLDKVGRPIPETVLELWNHAQEVGTRLRSAISAIKCELEKGIGHDKIFAELINSVISDAEALHYSLSQIVPFAVCPTCQGKLPERCTTCRHRGFISKFYWDGPAIGKDLRAIIQKQADKYASTTLSA